MSAPPTSEASSDRERLLHDVAKYIERTATNVPKGAPVPGALAPLLARDLYGREGEEPMAARFDRLAAGVTDDALRRCRARLARIETLEPAVRASEPAALAEAVELARAVAIDLRAWANR